MSVTVIDSGRSLRLLRQVGGVVRLLRPANLLIMVVGVGVGGLLAGGAEAFEGAGAVPLLLAAVSVLLIGGGGNSLNDYYDLEIDRINRPERPLPSGVVSPRTAWVVWGIATGAGLALAALLSPYHVGIALGAALLLFLYDRCWKRTVLLGNLAVAIVTAATLVYGAWAVGEPGPALAGAVFAFLTTLAREIIKDVQDAPGDAAAGARTTAVVLGPAAAGRAACAVLAVTIALTPVPFLLFGYGGTYLLTVSVADALMLYGIARVQHGTPERAARASAALKGAMLAGIGALALAAAG